MICGIQGNFGRELAARGQGADKRIVERFKVFCFKFDLEALLPASLENLQAQLGAKKLKVSWRIPVEDQDHGHPPKRVVEELFRQHDMQYIEKLHPRLILSGRNIEELADRCPQCFKPFVVYLSEVTAS